MPEIEFVDVYQPPEPQAAVSRPNFGRHTVLGFLPALLTLAAAALAAWAPFRWLYTVTEPNVDNTFTSTDPGSNGKAPLSHIHADGWGRTFGIPAGSGGGGQHGLRYGIVYEVSAGLFVVAAVVLVLGHVSQDRHRRTVAEWAGRATSFVALGIAGALGATTYLDYLTIHDEFLQFARDSANPDSGLSVDGQPSVGVGDGWLIASIAAAVALVAIVASIVVCRAARVARNGAEVSGDGAQLPQNLGTYPAGTDLAGEQL